MKFSADTHYPSEVFDANGQKIPYVVSGDTETGLCVISPHDAQGVLFMGAEDKVVHALAKFKAPLKLVPMEPPTTTSDMLPGPVLGFTNFPNRKTSGFW